MDNKGLFLIIGGIILLLIIIIFVSIQEQKQWNQFVIDYNCKPVEFMQGSTSTGIAPSISGDGSVSVVVLTESDKTCYECDDGKRYWRNN